MDLNALLSATLQAAVEQATAPLVQRINVLETRLVEAALFEKTTTATIPVNMDALIEHLDKQEWFWAKLAGIVQQELDNWGIVSEGRVEELISNGFVVTPDDLKSIKDRIEELEEGKGLTTHRVETMIEEAISEHCSSYDHDEYDGVVSTVNDYDFDDFLTKDELNSELRDQINDTLSNATVSISV